MLRMLGVSRVVIVPRVTALARAEHPGRAGAAQPALAAGVPD